MVRSFVDPRVLLALLATAVLCVPASVASAKKGGARYGLEGRIVEFDESRNVLVVKVVKTKVSGSAGTGRVAGKPAPKGSFKRGADVEFAVVPEGSVLRRTVIKNQQGGGLDTTGTTEGFKKALGMVPEGKNVIFSFEKVQKPADGEPEWALRIIQVRISEEEWDARLQAMEEEAALRDAEEARADAAAGRSETQ
jgi:hypothetical protein